MVCIPVSVYVYEPAGPQRRLLVGACPTTEALGVSVPPSGLTTHTRYSAVSIGTGTSRWKDENLRQHAVHGDLDGLARPRVRTRSQAGRDVSLRTR